SYFAIFFILWWLVLFAVLPFGVRPQQDDEIVLGVERGAPAQFSLMRKMLATTLVALAIFAVYYVVTVVLGYSFDDIPTVIPSYK
ncbi:MAG TPA: DUF1467 family protein, partial [Pararhizobium sp.]|nr:DUF1467 family protein [Pararhizobium sp.]